MNKPCSQEDLAVDLKNRITLAIQKFWKECREKKLNIDKKDMFMINSLAMSCVVSMITACMFTKDAPQKPKFEYIDGLALQAKEMLALYDDFRGMMNDE